MKIENTYNSLGAAEILAQNNEALDFNGYKPTYTILSDYSHLIAPALGKLNAKGQGGLNETINQIKSVILKSRKQVTPLAHHLYSKKPAQAAFNVWHFLVTNLKYDYDKPGFEEIRTPARSYADRNHRVDCEDMAIFAACLLLEMGYKPFVRIVGFNGNGYYQHIYTMLGSTVIDAVLKTFNKTPENITKQMDIQVLNGVEAPAKNVMYGLGAVPAQTTLATQKLQDVEAELLAKLKANPKSESLKREARKLRYAIMLNGTDEQAVMVELMHLVYDIAPDGNFIFNGDEAAKEFIEAYNNIEADEAEIEAQEAEDILQGIQDEQSALLGLLGLGDLGRRRSSRRKARKARRAARKSKRKARRAKRRSKGNIFKRTGQALKKVSIKNVFKAVKRLNPLFVAGRGSYLALVRLNFKGWASRLALGYLTAAQAKKQGINAADHARLVAATKQAERLWEKDTGGKASKLRAAVMKGKDKGKGAKRLGFRGTESGLGVEPTTTAAIIASATPIIAILAKAMTASKKIKVGGKEIDLENIADGADDLLNDPTLRNEDGSFNQEAIKNKIATSTKNAIKNASNNATTKINNAFTPSAKEQGFKTEAEQAVFQEAGLAPAESGKKLPIGWMALIGIGALALAVALDKEDKPKQKRLAR